MLATFTPANPTHRPKVKPWLTQDYVAAWIHGQGLQNTLNGFEKFLDAQSRGEGLDRQTTLTQHWVGYDGATPFVYLLTTNVFPGGQADPFITTSGPIITLDIFIIDRDYVGKGLATTIIRSFLDTHFSDVTEVFIDPEKTNTRAIHVYEKAGFKIVSEFIAPWHPVPHWLMKYRRTEDR